MTPLDALIEGASGDKIPVSTLLRQVKVIASRSGVQPLEAWVDHELRGYPADAELPDYRAAVRVQVLGTFRGPFGSGVENAPIAPTFFPEAWRDGYLFQVSFPQAIAQVEELARSDKALHAAWPADVIANVNYKIERGEITGLYDGLGLATANRIIPAQHFVGIVDAVRTRILDLALALESVAPDAGERDAARPDPQTVQNINTIVYSGATNIAVASTNVEQSIALPAQGDLAGLLSFLRLHGVDDEEVSDLEHAIEADGDSRELGERTQAWLGRMALGASKAAAAGLGTLAVRAVASYFGLPVP